jgi:AbrB family looped-hinge helix DNA binding protein
MASKFERGARVSWRWGQADAGLHAMSEERQDPESRVADFVEVAIKAADRVIAARVFFGARLGVLFVSIQNRTTTGSDRLVTRLSTSGRVVIPKALRTARRWKPGMQFVVEATKEGILLTPKPTNKTLTRDDIVGCARYKGPRASIRQMDAGVMAEARRHS